MCHAPRCHWHRRLFMTPLSENCLLSWSLPTSSFVNDTKQSKIWIPISHRNLRISRKYFSIPIMGPDELVLQKKLRGNNLASRESWHCPLSKCYPRFLLVCMLPLMCLYLGRCLWQIPRTLHQGRDNTQGQLSSFLLMLLRIRRLSGKMQRFQFLV